MPDLKAWINEFFIPLHKSWLEDENLNSCHVIKKHLTWIYLNGVQRNEVEAAAKEIKPTYNNQWANSNE